MTRKLDYEFVKQQFANSGCVLLSTNYIRSDDRLNYVCSCGNKSKISWDSFKQGTRCMRCAGFKKRTATKGKPRPNARSKQRLSYDEVKKRFEDAGCKLTSINYKNNTQKLEFICNCGRKSVVCLNAFQSDKQRCSYCSSIKKSAAISAALKGKLNPKQSKTMKRLFAEGKKVIWNKGKPNPVTAKRDLENNPAKTPEARKKNREKRLLQVLPFRDTSIEVALQQKLTEAGVQYEKHKPILGQPDVFIEPNICIFADGDFFHANPVKYSSESMIFKGVSAEQIWKKDENINKRLRDRNYVVLRFWERDINNNLDSCVNEILKRKGELKNE